MKTTTLSSKEQKKSKGFTRKFIEYWMRKTGTERRVAIFGSDPFR